MKAILTELETVPRTSPSSDPNRPAPKPGTDSPIEEKTWAQLEEHVTGLGKHLQLLADCSDDHSRAAECTRFQLSVHALEKCAAANWRQAMIRVAAALEAFLSELQSKPHQITESRLRTLALAVEVLSTLIKNPESKQEQSRGSTAVVVDAEKVSGTAACNALRNAGFNPAKFSGPDSALIHLSANAVDLVVLDMPAAGESGFELYNKLRELPLHHDPPVIFVTDMCEMKCPAGTVSNSETQFLAKPHNMLSYLELALKALSRVLQFRVTSRPNAPVASPLNSVAPASGQVLKPSQGEGTTSPNQKSTMKADSSKNSEQQPSEPLTKAAPAPALTRELSQCTPELEKEFADLEKEKEERQLAEQQLITTRDLSTHLRDCLASFEAAKLSFKRTQEHMEAQMQGSLKATGESEARLQKETAERQRFEEALAAAKRAHQAQAAEVSKLQSAFQVEQAERQRLQGDAIQARYASLDSARAGLTAGHP